MYVIIQIRQRSESISWASIWPVLFACACQSTDSRLRLQLPVRFYGLLQNTLRWRTDIPWQGYSPIFHQFIYSIQTRDRSYKN